MKQTKLGVCEEQTGTKAHHQPKSVSSRGAVNKTASAQTSSVGSSWLIQNKEHQSRSQGYSNRQFVSKEECLLFVCAAAALGRRGKASVI